MYTYEFAATEKQKSCFELIFFGLRHGQRVKTGLGDGQVKTFRKLGRLFRQNAVIESQTGMKNLMVKQFSYQISDYNLKTYLDLSLLGSSVAA